jgi:hypothetical protein
MYFSTATHITYETIMLISLKFGMEVMPLKVSLHYNLNYPKYYLIVFTLNLDQ